MRSHGRTLPTRQMRATTIVTGEIRSVGRPTLNLKSSILLPRTKIVPFKCFEGMTFFFFFHTPSVRKFPVRFKRKGVSSLSVSFRVRMEGLCFLYTNGRFKFVHLSRVIGSSAGDSDRSSSFTDARVSLSPQNRNISLS